MLSSVYNEIWILWKVHVYENLNTIEIGHDINIVSKSIDLVFRV